jgi:hypothetical protein
LVSGIIKRLKISVVRNTTEDAIKYGFKNLLKLTPALKIGTISVWSAIFAVKKITAIKFINGERKLR